MLGIQANESGGADAVAISDGCLAIDMGMGMNDCAGAEMHLTFDNAVRADLDIVGQYGL